MFPAKMTMSAIIIWEMNLIRGAIGFRSSHSPRRKISVPPKSIIFIPGRKTPFTRRDTKNAV